MINAVQAAVNQAKADANIDEALVIHGKAEIDTTEIENADKQIDKFKKKAEKGVEVPVKAQGDIAKDIEGQIKKAKKTVGRKAIEVTNDEIYHSPKMQAQIKKLHGKLQSTEDKVNQEDRNRLTKGQALDYARAFLEYKMYADEFGFIIKDSFREIFYNLEEYMTHESDHLQEVFQKPFDLKQKGDRAVKDGGYYIDEYSGKRFKRERSQMYEEAEESFMRKLGTATAEAKTIKRQQMHSSTTSVTRQKPDGSTTTKTSSNQTTTTTGKAMDNAIQEQNQYQAELEETSEKEKQMATEARAIAQSIANDFGITKKTVDELAQAIQEMITSLEETGRADYSKIIDILSADTKMKDEFEKNYTNNEAIKEARKFLRSKQIKTLPEYKSEFGDDWGSVQGLLGIGVMRKEGQDLIEVLGEMNGALGTTFDLDVSNAGGLVQLVDYLRSAADVSARLVEYLGKAENIDLSSIIGQIEQAALRVNPKTQIKKDTSLTVDEDGFMVPSDDGELSFLDGLSDGLDRTARSYRDAAEAAEEFAEAQEKANKEAQSVAKLGDAVYHAGAVSKLNKAETNGRFYGSNRGTGYFGTGHYFVDAATKHELMDDGNYSKLPFTSVDISKYDNLFDARNNDELAGKLHDFLQRLTRYTQGEDRYSVPELFGQFEDVFGKSVLSMNEFEARLSELKNYMQSSSIEDRNDSVSTQFMKSLGYGGVDTRGTRYADTRYGTVIYDLKEESILQANITDELEKQGNMLEKRNYAAGEVWDQNEDKRIQGIIDEQKKRAEIQEEFKKIYDTDNGQKVEDDFDAAQNRLREIDNIIAECTSSIESAEIEFRAFYDVAQDMGISLSEEEVQDEISERKKAYTERIQELQEERVQIEATIPVLKERYETEKALAREAWEQAERNVEERYKSNQTPDTTTDKKPTKSENVNKFISDSKDILDEFGKTPHDILPDWQDFINQLSSGAMTADEALQKLRGTLESLSSESPEPTTLSPDVAAKRREEIAKAGKTEQEIIEGLIQAYQNLEKQKEHPVKRPGISDSEARRIIEGEQEDYIKESKRYGVDLVAEVEKRKQAAEEEKATLEAVAEAEESLEKTRKKSSKTKKQTESTAEPQRKQEKPQQTTEDIEKATDAIKAEGEAAKTAAKEKESFVNANMRAAESASKTGDAARDAADGIKDESNAAGTASDRLVGNADSAPEKNRIIKTHDSDTKHSKTYQDENGRTYEVGVKLNKKENMWEPFSVELTNYLSLERDAIRVTNQLADAQLTLANAENQANPDQALISSIKEYIALLEEEQDAINQQAVDYANENVGYTVDLFNERVREETDKHQAQNNIKQAQSFANAENIKQRALEETAVLIERQGSVVELFRKKYTDAIKDTVSDDDFNNLEELYANIQTKMTNMSGRATTRLEREELSSMIKEFKQEIKNAQDRQKVSMEMRAFDPKSAREKLTTQFNSLLRDMQKSNADTEELEKELNEVIAKFEKSGENTPAYFNAQNNIRRSLEQRFKNKQGEYEYNEFQIKQMTSAVDDFERATQKYVQAQTAMDAATDKSDPRLIQNLNDAKAAADEAYESMLKVANVFDDSIMSDSSAAKMADRIQRVTGAYLDPQQTAYYKSATKKASIKGVRSDLTNYANARKEYQALYEKALSGDIVTDDNGNIIKATSLTNEEFAKLQSALRTIVSIESNWNDAKADGIALSQKQLQAKEQLKDASNGMTKAELEANAANEKATKLYAEMQRKVERMKGQTDWRSEGWSEAIRGIEAELEKQNPADVFTKEGYTAFENEMDAIMRKYQEVSKSIDFQDVGRDWQAKQRADLAKWMDQNKIAAKAFREELQELNTEIDQVGSKGGAEEWSAKFYKIQEDAANRGLLGKSLGDRFKDQFKNTMTSLATYYLSFQDFIRYGREAISIVTELDTQLTEMRKVSNESLNTLQQYQLETFDIASRVGTTAAQIQASTADWLRLGENLQQAKKSAEYSTLLLNVSEFENVGAATESLVAMSQAYQDMDKLDIIDKLNNIGNNFSISTSELASSLQLSAGTLKVAGNSLDEAIALTVAGNQVLQDPRKVGQSLRTISLRLTGTSVEDMQEAGEEIDGLISTQSKLRQTIMDATKVKSNGFTGFDILNDNGNYKTTYEMLEGISKVWKEIGEEDRKMGTNRQSFLLETIAGKTRAAAAASILDNFDKLQEVYESSLESEGSAQEELDKYLDSINGKVAQFKNRLQELTSITIDSQWIKDIVDFGTEGLEVVSGLAKQFGGINLIFGSIGGVLLQKTGRGLFNYDKENKTIGTIFQKMGANASQKFGDGISSGLFTELQNAFGNNNLNTTTIGQFMDSDAFSGLSESLQNYINSIPAAERSTLSLASVLEKTKVSVTGIGTAFNSLASIGKTALSTIGNIAISMLAMFVIEKIISGIEYVIHETEHLIKKGQEAQNEINNIYDQYTNKKNTIVDVGSNIIGDDKKHNTEDTIDAIAKRYDELHKSVNDFTNENISLTNDEYAEYITLCNQIAEQFPSLVSGYDDQSNAILSLGDSADTAKTKLSDLLTMQQLSAHVEMGKNMQDVYAGILAQQKEYNGQIEEANVKIQQLENSSFEPIQIGTDMASIDVGHIDDVKNYLSDTYKILPDALASRFNNQTGRYDMVFPGLRTLSKDDINNVNEYLETLYEAEDIAKNQAKSTKVAIQMMVEDQWASLSEVIGKYLQTSKYFTNLNEDIQNAVIGNIADIDTSKIADEYEGDILQFVYNELIEPLSNLGEEQQINLSELFVLDISKSTVKDYKENVMSVLTDAFGEDAESFFDLLNFDKQIEEKEKLQDKIKSIFGDDVIGIDEMTGEELEAGSALIDKNGRDYYESFSDFVDAIQKKIASRPKIEKDGTLSALFSDETYKESSEAVEKRLSSLTTALESIRSEGKLTAEQMRDLEKEFPKLAVEAAKNDGFLTEGIISDTANKELNAWLKDIRERMKDLSPEERAGANKYLESLVASYGRTIDSVNDLREAYLELYSVEDVNTATHVQRAGQATLFDTQIQRLQEQLAAEGEQMDLTVVYTMIASDQFSGTAEKIKSNYDHTKITYDLVINLNKAKERLEKFVESAQKDIDHAEAENAKKEARGQFLRRGDYRSIVGVRDEIAREKRSYATEAYNAYRNARVNSAYDYNHRNQLYEDYVQADTDALNAEAEALEARKQQDESILNSAQKRIEMAQASQAEAQQEIDEAIANGTTAGQDVYDRLATAQEHEAKAQLDLADAYDWLVRNTNWDDAGYRKQAADARSASVNLQGQATQTRGTPTQNNLDELGRDLTDIQNQAQKVNDLITLKQTKGLKATEREYKTLSNLAKQQIKNLQRQNDELQNQADTLDNEADKAAKLNEIASNESTISKLYADIINYDNQAKNLVVEQAKQLASDISTAISETLSETGLSSETIQSLITDFSDLGEAVDISSVFYNTADGVKANFIELERLVQKENDLKQVELDKNINETKEALERLSKQDAGADKIKAAQDLLRDYIQQQAEYYAQYEAMMKEFSDHSAIERADQTENQGANYDKGKEYLKAAKEAYDKGLIGTDDFKTRAAYFNAYGFSDPDSFISDFNKVSKYMTDDISGVNQFMNDLVSEGLASMDESTGAITMNFTDIADAARKFKGGVGIEWFRDMFGKADEYGGAGAFVGSISEASLKLADLQTELTDAKIKYADLISEGASEEVLQKQQEVITGIEDQLGAVHTATENFVEGQKQSYVEGFTNLKSQLDYLKESYDSAEDEQSKERFKSQMEDLADKYHVKLTADLELDEESYKTQQENMFGKVGGYGSDNLLASEAGAQSASKYSAVVQKLNKAHAEGDEILQDTTKTLSKYTAEQLRSINLSDGQYDDTFEGAVEAEQALDTLAAHLGLTTEEAQELAAALFGVGEVHAEPEVDTTEMEANLEKGKQDIEQMQQMGDITIGINLEDDVTSMDMSQLQTRLQGLGNIQAKLEPGSDASAYIQQLQKETEVQIEIQTYLDENGEGAIEKLKGMSDEDIETKVGVDTSEIDIAKEQIDQMQQDFDLVVHIDDSQFAALTATDTTVNVNNETALGKVQEIADAINDLPDGDPKVDADTAQAQSKLTTVEKKISDVDGLSANPTVDVSGNYATAGNYIDNLASSINQLHDKEITITVNRVHNGSSSGGSEDGPMPAVNGTAHVLGSAFAYGTALARGNWGLKKPGETLVGELGEELVVDPHTANWYTVGTVGAEFVDLPKDAIVFNHKQTKSLFKNGWVTGRGKAYADGETPGKGAVYTWTGGKGGADTTAVNNNTNAVEANTSQAKKTGKSSNNAAKKIEAFQKWLDSLKDWIEVRLQRWEEKMDLYTTKSENAVGAGNKNAYISSVEAWNNEQRTWNEQGEKRYLQQADAVLTRAKSNGLLKSLDQKQINDLVANIQNGTIDISEYSDENVRKFIDSYSEWYDKAMECRQGVEDCIAKAKELEQMRLDNITDQFDGMLGYVESVSSTSESLINLLTSKGAAINNATAKNSLQSQMKNQNTITGYLKAELEVYGKELARAKDIYKEGSNEYNEALTKYQDMLTAVNESEQKYYELNKTLGELDITVRDNLISRLKSLGENLASLLSLRQARNNKYSDANSESLAGYNALLNSQVSNNQSVMQQYYNDILHRMDMIAINQWQVDNPYYQEYYEAIMSDVSAIYGLLNANEELKKSIRENNWKPFVDLQKRLQDTTNDFGHLREMITDSQMFDDNGEGTSLTDRGYASLALLAEQLATAKKQISDYRAALTKLTQDYKNGNISIDEYNETSREYVETIQSLAKATVDYEDQVAKIYETRITNENNLLQKLISSRKEALQSKKEQTYCSFYLIAGNPLELQQPQHKDEIYLSVMVENVEDWEISSEAPNRGTFNDQIR